MTNPGGLPDIVRFGTSSWAYEGWQGQGYRKPYSKSRFARDSLAEYAAYRCEGRRLFRIVGIDHTFYRPATEVQLGRYAVQMPEDFRFCSKVCMQPHTKRSERLRGGSGLGLPWAAWPRPEPGA